ncbi:pseudouridine synthase [Robiginitomaculum antarcticum]|uniref:pseudouridine synthase n=1 Tax=Robiginitomaculum antarcticum TaxID=437507 RepID=UPI001F1CEB99|nr:pseudouridine synthase [Robiginitomaculum antarcticum]
MSAISGKMQTHDGIFRPPHYGRIFDYAPPATDFTPQGRDIIYCDDHIIVASKPPGLLSVDGKSDGHKDSLSSRMAAAYPGARIVHRLDMATSGVIIFARTPEAMRHIGLQFERRHVEKSYIAQISGHPDSDNGEIDAAIICDWPRRPLQMIDFAQGRKAVTRWEVISCDHKNTSRIKLTPVTGRSHQLRLHMLYIRHPILGDRLYAPDAIYAAAPRLYLHAHTLSIFHPAGGARVTFKAPCPF